MTYKGEWLLTFLSFICLVYCLLAPSTFFETTTWIQQLKNHTFTACIATYIMFGHQGILLRLSNKLALSGFIQTHFLFC